MWGIFGLTWTVGCVPRTHRLGLIGDQVLQKTLTHRLPHSPEISNIFCQPLMVPYQRGHPLERIRRTGVSARERTFWVTLPNIHRVIPDRPWVHMTIRSVPLSFA